MQARKELYVISTETPQTTTNPSQTLPPVYKLAHLPLLTSKTPTTFSSAFYADALQMKASGLVHWPKYTWSVYHLSVVYRKEQKD